MTTGSRTEGVRGVGSNGFIRTVANLTVTGDLVVLGENRSLAGTGSYFWEVADANAEYWAFELPTGTSEHVPVLGIGIGLDGVDLGLFNGITQTTMAVIDADRDSAVTLTFSADDVARLDLIGEVARIGIGRDGDMLHLGTDADIAILHSADVISGDAELTNAIEGTSVHPATAADSLIISNVTDDGDILVLVSKAGNSNSVFWADGSTGDTSIMASASASVDVYIAGTKEIDYSTGSLSFQQATSIGTATGNLTLAAVSGADVLIGDNVVLLAVDGGTGTLAINPAGATGEAVNWSMVTGNGAFTSGGASSVAAGMDLRWAITAANGDTSWQTQAIVRGSIVTQGNSETIADISTLRLQEPTITVGSGDTVTNAATLLIVSAPTEGTNDYALFVDGGISRLDGGVIIGDATSTNNLLDDASNGSGTTTLYIGNATVTVSSDVRLKEDIEDTRIDALDLMDKLRVVDFAWNDPTDESPYGRNYRGRYTGMLAQETIKVAPWIINDQGGGRDCPQCMGGLACTEHGSFQVEYQHLVPTLVKAVQELRQEIRTLKEKPDASE